MRYRKKPVEVEAVQFTRTNDPEVQDHLDTCEDWWYAEGLLHIDTLEGTMTASVGDYIIKGVQGEFYPCKPDIFEATYEPVTA